MKPKDKLNSILVEAVSEGLAAICGSAATSVIFFLKETGSIKSMTNVEDLEAFAEGLEGLFGFGARVIEEKILETLRTKLQLSRSKETENDFKFIEEIEEAIEFYQSKRMKNRSDPLQQKTHARTDPISTCVT